MTRMVGISLAPIQLGIIFSVHFCLQLLSAQEDSTRFTLDSMLISRKLHFSFHPSTCFPKDRIPFDKSYTVR